MKPLATLTLLACLPLFAACQRDAPPPATPDGQTADATPKTALGRTVAKAMEEARSELRESDLNLNGDYDVRISGARVSRSTKDLPPAHITRDGQLVISGTEIRMDDSARATARAYRESIIAIAEAGMDIGVQGADLGMQVAREAIGSLFRGDTDQIEKRIKEAEGKQLEAAALQLCEQLPGLLSAQQSLAATVPEFAPYARMEASDVDECGAKRESVAAEIAAREQASAQPAPEAQAAPATDDATR
ncbi:MAG TPA: hypothetical protein PK743_00325 [Luteimonas sp.]|nr:hypothetical protein [Luteimonas sp.]